MVRGLLVCHLRLVLLQLELLQLYLEALQLDELLGRQLRQLLLQHAAGQRD
jgi:hypothetical protein